MISDYEGCSQIQLYNYHVLYSLDMILVLLPVCIDSLVNYFVMMHIWYCSVYRFLDDSHSLQE